MKYSTEVKAVGAIVTLSSCLLTYALMAGIACFASWTNEYWNLANWDGLMRAFLFLIWAFLIARGVWTTAVMLTGPKP